MIVVFCIIAVVALVSLYDYFNSRSWQQVTSSERNDTVFAKRNRAYGAYEIRRDYDKRLVLIIAGLAGGVGILYAATRNGEIEERVIAPKMIEYIYNLPDKTEEEKPDEIAATKPAATSPEQTQAVNEIRPSDTDPEVTPTIPDPTIAVGVVANPGGEPGFGEPGDPKPGVIGGGGVTETKPDDKPEIYVDEPAEYPGGRPAMFVYLKDNLNYPEIAQELNLQGKCHLQFVVSKVGDISHVTVMRGVPDCKECDKEAVRVVKGMPLWKPGKIKGKPVDSYFNLPITFTLN